MPRVPAVPSLPIALDRSFGHGLQEQLSEALRRSIAAGTLTGGSRLPSIRELTQALGVSRTTVALSLQKLADEGLLIPRERSGVFVAPGGGFSTPAPSVRGPVAASALELSGRGRVLAAEAPPLGARRPRAFRLSRPALELFPVREWNRLQARRAARTTLSQLDYQSESSELRSAVAALVSAMRGTRVEAGRVLLFSGSQRALEFAAVCLLEPGEAAWMEDPGYPGARQALRAAGARVVPRPLDAEGISLRGGRGRPPRLVYVTPSNQFPLGGAMSLARREELLAFADETDACVIEDDYDVEFSAEGARLPALAALDRAGRVIYVGSFSRTTAPALRIGYLVAPAGLAGALRRARAALDDPLSSITQLTLADFIAKGHFARHLRRMRKAVAARRRALIDAVERAPPLRLRGAATGLHAVVELPAGCDDGRASETALSRGIEAAPLSRFCASVALPPALVLGFATVRPEDMGASVRALAAAVTESHRPRRRRATP